MGTDFEAKVLFRRKDDPRSCNNSHSAAPQQCKRDGKAPCYLQNLETLEACSETSWPEHCRICGLDRVEAKGPARLQYEYQPPSIFLAPDAVKEETWIPLQYSWGQQRVEAF